MNLSGRVVVVIAVTVLALPLSVGHVAPMDRDGRFFALGVGKRPCSDYVKFREKKLDLTPEQYDFAQHVLENWVAGFLTAHNYYVTDTYDVQGSKTILEIQQRVETYCRDNPSNYFVDAVIALALALHPTRVISERATLL